jgi:hypothetical protein
MAPCHRRESFVGALHDALAADVDPAAGGHLPVHRQAALLEVAEIFPRRPRRDEQGVGDQDARRARVRLEHTDRLAGLHQQRLVVFEHGQRAHDRVIRCPVARRLAGSAVDDQIVGPFSDVRIQIVHQHPQRGFLLPPFAGERGASRRADRSGCCGHGGSRTER